MEITKKAMASIIGAYNRKYSYYTEKEIEKAKNDHEDYMLHEYPEIMERCTVEVDRTRDGDSDDVVSFSVTLVDTAGNAETGYDEDYEEREITENISETQNEMMKEKVGEDDYDQAERYRFDFEIEFKEMNGKTYFNRKNLSDRMDEWIANWDAEGRPFLIILGKTTLAEISAESASSFFYECLEKAVEKTGSTKVGWMILKEVSYSPDMLMAEIDEWIEKESVISIGSAEAVPTSFREKWGSEAGCPCYDENGNLVGYAASMPSNEREWKKALETFMSLEKEGK